MLQVQSINTIPTPTHTRIPTGIDQFDHLIGGGLVPGATILFAGQPGIGKSTFLLQLANAVATSNTVLYISGEESLSQMKLRADRLGTSHPELYCSEAIAIEDIIALIEKINPTLLVVDSLQMMYSRESKAAHGSPTQIKKALLSLIHVVKQKNIIMIAIGHSTKSGKIAGMLTLQHMVDMTMFMSKSEDGVRLLEILKSRYGSADVMWSLEMGERGFSAINQKINVIHGHDTALATLNNTITNHSDMDATDIIIACIKLAIIIPYLCVKLITKIIATIFIKK